MEAQAKPVLTKRDFVTRYAANEFGNRAPTWDSLVEWMVDPLIVDLGESQLYHIRNRVAGGPTWYDVSKHSLPSVWADITLTCNTPASTLYISAMAPTERTILQGEVYMTERGLELFYSQVKKPMRDALAEKSDRVTGLRAYTLLRSHLCPNSYDWLCTLLERYPGHVVEFSTYSGEKWGTLAPKFNTVYWEVRKY